MSKERSVKISLSFLCEGEEGPPILSPREQSGNAISRINTFVGGEAEGSIFQYEEHRFPEGHLRLDFLLDIVVSLKTEDDNIETKLDNNLPLFPPLFGNRQPVFKYISKGI